MSAGPVVSVLLPAFRARAFISRSISSALSQTFTDLELIVVDNASDDGTHEAALAFAKLDDRVRVFRNSSNIGPLRNWRECAKRSRGHLTAMLFADDWYEPGFLEHLVPQLREPSVGLAYSAVRVTQEVDLVAKSQSVLYQWPSRTRLAAREFLDAAFEQDNAVPVSPACCVLRSEDARLWLNHAMRCETEFEVLSHGAGADQWLFLEACRHYPEVAHISSPLVNFSSHGGNLTYRPGILKAYAAARLEYAESACHWSPSSLARARMAKVLRRTKAAKRAYELLGPIGFLQLARLYAQRVPARMVAMAAGKRG